MLNSCVCYLDRSAEIYPDSIALDDAINTYTYSQLRRKAHLWATAIASRVSSQRTPIAIVLPRSADCIVAFMAVLYTGNFYVMLDTQMPSSRLVKILKSLSPSLILTKREVRKLCSSAEAEEENLLYLDEISGISAPPHEKYAHTVDTDPLYLIFTSGSTGTPKGVVVPHKAVMGYVDWALECCGFTHEDHVGHVLPFHYVAADKAIYPSFAAGARLTVISQETYQNPAHLMEFLKREQITSLDWVPSGLGMTADMGLLANADELSLRRVMFAGEVMPMRVLDAWRKALPKADFYQSYGASEARAVMQYKIERSFAETDSLPLGFPRPNTGALLIDEQGRLIEKKGVVGEIYLYGSPLALGYWGDPEKTAAAFVQNPLHNSYSDRMFRTGDLAMYNEFGELVYQGRSDSRIKHLGHRIELREIEVAASRIDGFRRVCVQYDAENKQIILFYEADEIRSPNDIRAQLREWLPRHMLPLRYIGFGQFPQTPTGKIDRMALWGSLQKE